MWYVTLNNGANMQQSSPFCLCLTQVPLGVILKNENVLNEMIDIVDVLHKYIPKTTSTQTFNHCARDGRAKAITVNIDHFNHILVGGDQLTVSRFHGSQGILHNCDNGGERGEGLIPVIEDWHTKMCFMKVCVL